MKKIIFFLSFISFSGFAQQTPKHCGTKTPKEPIRISKSEMANFRQSAPYYTTPLAIKLYFTIFAENNGAFPATLNSDLYRQIQNCVNQFAPHGICFIVGGVRQINNSDLNFQDADTEESELDPYMMAGYLNVFVHLNLEYDSDILNGISYGIPANRISLVGQVIDQPNNGNITTMAHELGHAMGLYHTFETAYGAESVARSGSCADCDGDGDLLCSTPADPDDENNYLANNTTNTATVQCVYTGTRLDDCNQLYTPQLSNIMAYGNRWCRNNFTSEQGDRMRYILLNTLFQTLYWQYIANDTETITGSQNFLFGAYEGLARDLYHVQPSGGLFFISGTTNYLMKSRKIQINSNARFSPGVGGRVLLQPNTYCN